ncbi:MAG: matrixin family metalloprotease [Candidatus Rokuibacteriota bacterium]
MTRTLLVTHFCLAGLLIHSCAWGYVLLLEPPANRLTFALSLGSTPFSSLEGINVSFDSIAEAVLADWNDVGIGPLQDTVFFSSFRTTTFPVCSEDGVNVVSFSAFGCFGFAWGDLIGVTKRWMRNGRSVEVDVLFDSARIWDFYSGPQIFFLGVQILDFYRVAAHEFGHALGLGHEDDVLSVMRSVVSDIDRIQTDDVLGAHALQYSPFGVNPLLLVSPVSSFDFGEITVGMTADRTFTLQNLGGSQLVGAATATGAFSCISRCNYTLGIGEAAAVVIRFTPGTTGPFIGEATFTGGGGAAISLSGTGTLPTPATLTITYAGTGAGTVAALSLVSCTATCATVLTNGQSLTLIATAGAGSMFVGWQGGPCSSTRPCALTMNSNIDITATFVALTNSSISLVAAVLPSSRSVQVGAVATAFATIINGGPETATFCRLSPLANVPADFNYQTTDPATNRVTGTADTPVTIPRGAAQSFVFAVTPTSAFPPTELQLRFDCANAAAAPINIGLNTLLLSASSTPIPDIVALGATLSGDGIVNIVGAQGTGVFAVATVNVGASGTIIASADTGSVPLPISLSLCQTNPSTGQCVSPIGSSVTTPISSFATPTFALFVQGAGIVLFDPARHRIYVRFRDAGGTTRGSTGVAVRTQ